MAFKQKLALVALALHFNRLLLHLKAAAFWFYIIIRLHTTLENLLTTVFEQKLIVHLSAFLYLIRYCMSVFFVRIRGYQDGTIETETGCLLLLFGSTLL